MFVAKILIWGLGAASVAYALLAFMALDPGWVLLPTEQASKETMAPTLGRIAVAVAAAAGAIHGAAR